MACVLLSALGWGLSFFGQLNKLGYSVGLLVCAGFIAYCLRRGGTQRRATIKRLFARFRRPLPAAYLFLVVLAALGGILYAPSNYDALAYRIPRVLHWLAEGKWLWVESHRGWLNTRACGFEWLSAPVLLFFKTDRPLFLFNVISFLLLPGLVFSFFTRLGIRARTAWHWMWLLPTAACFVIQAGSVANDLYGAVLAVAAMDFALRAKSSGRVSDVWFSVLAAAAMTNAKSSNLPLLLPWAIAIFPSVRLLVSRPAVSISVAGLALLGSLVPISVMNQKYCGDWTGIAAEDAWLRPPSAIVCAAHNAGLLLLHNFAPPVFPLASSWNRAVQGVLPESWKATVDRFAESGRSSYNVRELPGEEHAGAGLMLLVLVAVFALARCRMPRRHKPAGSLWTTLILVSPWVSLAVFMGKSGIAAPGRLVAPYYALLLPLLIGFVDARRFLRTRWWRGLFFVAFAAAAFILVLSPARPLWPALTVLERAGNYLPPALAERAKSVYWVYRHRADHFAAVRADLPPDVKALGLVTSTEAETSLWRPFGTRRVFHIFKTNDRDQLERKRIRFILINEDLAEFLLGAKLVDWLAEVRGNVVRRFTFRHLASGGPSRFVLVQIGDAPPGSEPLSQNAH